MVRRRLRLAEIPPGEPAAAASITTLAARFLDARQKLGIVEDFPEPVTRAARAAAASWTPPELDLTDVSFATIDPPGSTDLDQAVAIRRRPGADGGHLVDYAIADVPAFVAAGGAVDGEARRRGQTLYAPDRRIPLHPPVLSEDAASLLPGLVRPAFVWRFSLAGDGRVEDVRLIRALIRSRERFDYTQVQRAANGIGSAGAQGQDGLLAELAALLREVGERRIAQEKARGGASLPLPTQEIDVAGGSYILQLRAGLPAEDWNAQLSLMTGMAAAAFMLQGGLGVLRTMAEPDPEAVAAFRRRVLGLGVIWPLDEPYGELLRRLDRSRPGDLAALHAAVSLFRGAGYVPFEGAPPAQPHHAALAAPYTHVTAPLRRLVDRFSLVIAHAVANSVPVPGWAKEGLPSLPEAMKASDHLASQLDRACLDVVEAAVLSQRVGQIFDAVVVSENMVQIADPPVLAKCLGQPKVGAAVRVTLTDADPASGRVRFAWAGE